MKQLKQSQRDRHRYEAFALPYYSDKDPAHGAAHMRQILSRLDELSHGLEPPPRQDRLYFLACFHGLSKRVATDAAFRAEVERFLASLGWTSEETADALAALARRATDPQTPEECVVHDANACERLGAFGIAKAFTTGGAFGQSYEQTIAYYESYLDRTVFRTPRGRDLAEEGTAYAKAFLRRFRVEAGIALEAGDEHACE